jgi:hypothetical protein
MHNTGGDWTKIADRGPLNVNEHVNFYAKVGDSRSLTPPRATSRPRAFHHAGPS